MIFAAHGTKKVFRRYSWMDPDQDLLDQLDRQEAPSMPVIASMIGGMALLAGTVVYFTLSLQPNASRETALDAGVLIAIAAAAALGVGFRNFGN